MDTAYISALAALAGSAIGGMTSFATSWQTLHAQTKAQRMSRERDRRENLYGLFIDEASKLYADALQHQRDDPSQLMGIYALLHRIRLMSSSRVVESADRVIKLIADTYFAPNVSLQQLTSAWQEAKSRTEAGTEVDILREFAEVCREELREFGLP
jgi:hypothetical protein